ncbi:MAG: hypothetical protein ACRDD8_02870 [Bacteroidales bacterium]
MKKLQNELSVYVPSNIQVVENKVMQNHFVKEFQRMFCQMFEGCTATKAQGCWLGEDGEIVTEDIVIVSVNFNDELYKMSKMDPIYKLIVEMKTVMMQEAVSYKKNGELIIM